MIDDITRNENAPEVEYCLVCEEPITDRAGAYSLKTGWVCATCWENRPDDDDDDDDDDVTCSECRQLVDPATARLIVTDEEGGMDWICPTCDAPPLTVEEWDQMEAEAQMEEWASDCLYERETTYDDDDDDEVRGQSHVATFCMMTPQTACGVMDLPDSDFIHDDDAPPW